MTAQTHHSNRPSVRRTRRSLPLALLAFVALCATALPGQAADCDVKLQRVAGTEMREDENGILRTYIVKKAISIKKSQSPLGRITASSGQYIGMIQTPGPLKRSGTTRSSGSISSAPARTPRSSFTSTGIMVM